MKGDDANDDTLRTETTPDPRRSQREISTFKAPAERFALGDELGRGGMGKVIAARDVSLKRGVAIKKVLSTNEVDLERFDREVRITAELEHPSIVPIHDVGLDSEGRPFYVMRQIRGEPLSTRLSALSTLRGRLALLPNLLAVTDAAAFAHARRILHRDIKPANILLGSFGETLLIDWGLARREGEVEPKIPEAADSLPGGTLTVAGYVYGTPGYMAPEQARGEIVDARADVFAIGATLFHLLVGKGPYDGMSAGDRMQAAIEDVPAPFELLPDDAPGELRAIVTKAMAVDPAQRYADAGALAADLRAFLEGQLVGAHQYTLGERARRFIRRHRAAVVVGSLALLALIALGVFSLLRVIAEQREAEVASVKAEAALADFNDREERLLVEQASVTAEIDPVRSILYLRKLPVGSRHMAHAREVAAKAAVRGLPHGDHLHTQMISALALSPDHRYLASADRSGRIAVRELATQTPRVLGELQYHVGQVSWLDATTILTTAARGIERFSLATDSHDTLAADHEVASFTIAEPPDRIRFVDRKTKELLELTLATGTSRVVARGVEFALGSGERLAIGGPGGVRWWTPASEVVLTPIAASVEFNVAVSRAGDQVALATIDEVFVWDAAGIERGRWPVKYAMRPFFGPDALYVGTLRNSVVRLGTADTKDLVVARDRLIGVVQTSVGAGIAIETGELFVADGASVRSVSLQMTQAAHLEGRPDSSIVAMGSRTGEVEWWDLATVAPAPVFLGHYVPCGIDARETFVVVDGTSLIAIDRKTTARRQVLRFDQLTVTTCIGITKHGQIVAATTGFGGDLIDARTGAIRRVVRDWIAFDPLNDAVLFPSGTKLMQIDHGLGEPHALFDAPGPMSSIDVSTRWIAVRLEDGRLLRFDRETKAVVEITTWPGKQLVTESGDVWYSTKRWLWRWTERGAHPIGEFAAVIDKLGSDGNPVFVVLADSSQWTATAERKIRQITNMGRLLWTGRHGTAVFDWDGKLVNYSFAHDERIERPLAENAGIARLEGDERTTMVRLGAGYLAIFVDDVPDDPKTLSAWLDRVTNAELDPVTQVVRWRTSASPRTPRAP